MTVINVPTRTWRFLGGTVAPVTKSDNAIPQSPRLGRPIVRRCPWNGKKGLVVPLSATKTGDL